MTPRLLILSQYFPPEMGAPQARLSELGEGLVDRGWEVEVLTALPNYPTGRVFAGYRGWRGRSEQVGRLRVGRVPLWPAKSGIPARLVCYLSFAASAAFHGPRLMAPPDLVLAESPPLSIGLAARSLCRRWRCPYALNVSDLWLESFIWVGALRPGLVIRTAERYATGLYRGALAITGQSEEIVAHVVARAPGIPAAVITNGVDPARFGAARATAGARALLGPEPGPVFVFAGLLGIAQGLDAVLDLAAALPAAAPGRIVLVGDGPLRERLARRIEGEGIGRVRLVPPQPREAVPALLAAADAALVSLGTVLPGAVPSKIYEAMASALPILLIAGGEAARRVDEAGCGLTAPPGDGAAIRAAFDRLAADPALRRRLGDAGRRAAETVYHRDRIAARLDRFLRDTLATGRVARSPAAPAGLPLFRGKS